MSKTVSRADLIDMEDPLMDRLVAIYYNASDPSRGLDAYPSYYRKHCEPGRRDILRKYFNDNQYDVHIAYSESDPEKIEGYIAVRKENGWWHIEEVYTEPSDDRPGKRLMLDMQERARANKIAFVTLQAVSVDGSEDYYTSNGFYERYGFVSEGANHMKWHVT